MTESNQNKISQNNVTNAVISPEHKGGGDPAAISRSQDKTASPTSADESLAEAMKPVGRMDPVEGQGAGRLVELGNTAAETPASSHRVDVVRSGEGVALPESKSATLPLSNQTPPSEAARQSVLPGMSAKAVLSIPPEPENSRATQPITEPRPPLPPQPSGIKPPGPPSPPSTTASEEESTMPKPPQKKEEAQDPPFDLEEFIKEAKEHARGAAVTREIKALEQEIRHLLPRIPLIAIHRGLDKRELISCSHTRFGEVCRQLFPDAFEQLSSSGG